MSVIGETLCMETYPLCTSYSKIVQVGIQASETFTPYVMLSKTGYSNINLSKEEWGALILNNVVASEAFHPAGLMPYKSVIMLSPSLCLRADRAFDRENLVLQRKNTTGSTNYRSNSNDRDTVELWFQQGTWQKLSLYIPIITHLLEQRSAWCSTLPNIFNNLLTHIGENFPVAVQDAKENRLDKFKKVFPLLPSAALLVTSDDNIDAYRLLQEIAIEMPLRVMHHVMNDTFM
jgi:hypothetical protein